MPPEKPHYPKLTLSVPEPLRSESHIYAKKVGRSISQLVAELFTALTDGTGALITGSASTFTAFRRAAAKAGLTLSEWLVKAGKDKL